MHTAPENFLLSDTWKACQAKMPLVADPPCRQIPHAVDPTGNERGQRTGRAVTHARGLYFLSSTATLDFGLELYDIYNWFHGSRLRFSDIETIFK